MDFEASPTRCINLWCHWELGPSNFNFLLNHLFFLLSIRRGTLSKGHELLRKLSPLSRFSKLSWMGYIFCSWVSVLRTSPDKVGFWKCNGKPNSSNASCVHQRMTTMSSSYSESGSKLGMCGQVKGRLWESRHKPVSCSWFLQSKDRPCFSLFAFCLHRSFTKNSYNSMEFWGNTTKDHFLVQQTELEGTRPSSKPVQLTHVVWRPCKRCCFFRETGRKSLFFHFYPTYTLLSRSLHFTSNSNNWGTKAFSYYKRMINNNYQQCLVNMAIMQQSHCLPVSWRDQCSLIKHCLAPEESPLQHQLSSAWCSCNFP